jgi:glutamate transport system substrate-binding protein
MSVRNVAEKAAKHWPVLTASTVAAALAIALVIVVTGPDPAPTNTTLMSDSITVGVVDDGPEFDFGDLNPSGFDIDVMKYVGTQLGRPVTPTILTSAQRGSYLQSHTAKLVIATYSITPDRNSQGIDFAGPYLVTPQALLVRASDAASLSAPNGLKDQKVCTIRTTTASAVTIPQANMDSRADTTKGCVDQLDEGSATAVLTDELVLDGYADVSNGKYKVILSGVYGETQYYGIGLLGGQRTLCHQLDSVIISYLHDKWRRDFQDTLKGPANAPLATIGDFEGKYKPKDSDITAYSCKL